MKELTHGVYSWSVHSEEKKLDFNGYLLATGQAKVLVDPPPLTPAQADTLADLGPPDVIVITNRDHTRDAAAIVERFGCEVACHEADADKLGLPVARRLKDGDVVGGALEVVHLPFQKSPGECGLYWKARRLLLLGDALIGKPPGGLSLLPAGKYADPARARQGLARLASLDVEVLLLGDGAPILKAAGEALEAFLGR